MLTQLSAWWSSTVSTGGNPSARQDPRYSIGCSIVLSQAAKMNPAQMNAVKKFCTDIVSTVEQQARQTQPDDAFLTMIFRQVKKDLGAAAEQSSERDVVVLDRSRLKQSVDILLKERTQGLVRSRLIRISRALASETT